MKLNTIDLSKLGKPRTPNPRVIPATDPTAAAVIESSVRAADAEFIAEDQALDSSIRNTVLPEISSAGEPIRATMSRLVDDNFPFDPSQLEAIEGLAGNQYACMTGAAGTGKTTCLKKVVDLIQDNLPAVNMSEYFKSTEKPSDDPDDDYTAPAPDKLIPAVALCAYTGRASQMIKRNFPTDWHGNIMTIHRLLAYYPVWEEGVDPETGKLRKTMHFEPGYNEYNKLPWKVILIDESGMLSLDLWHNLWRACRPDTQIIMVGDINQLPPTHGKSIFGFAMAKWPSWELTHIHRQKGVNNSIVDSAWAIINGQYPKSDDYRADPDWKFAMMEIPADAGKASKHVRKWLEQIRGPLYDPIRDAVITPINAYKEGPGWQLGQDPLNRELAIKFNQSHDRYIIDAGRDRKYFAVGDKVMATKNDHQIGITNGMTGVITDIVANPAYAGNASRFGLISDVNDYLNGETGDEEAFEMSLEDLTTSILATRESAEKKPEKAERGPASHSVVVNFGTEDLPKFVTFNTLAEVESLMMAYVMTCHKMQGGECPTIIIIAHQAHKRMLNREWLYTAITRASQRCIVLYTRMGLSSAVNTQTIKGKNLKEKVASFNRMIDPSAALGVTIKVMIPDATTKSTGARSIMTRPAATIAKPESTPLPKTPPKSPAPEIHLHVHTHAPHDPIRPTIDGGRLEPEGRTVKVVERLESPKPLVPQLGAYRVWRGIQDAKNQRLLPAPAKATTPIEALPLSDSTTTAKPTTATTAKPKVKLNLFVMKKKGEL